MKLLAYVIIVAVTLVFATLTFAQQPPRTLEQIQAEFTQWQEVFNKANSNYAIGMKIIERAQANMQQAKTKLQELVEEAKQIQATKQTEKPPVEEAPVK